MTWEDFKKEVEKRLKEQGCTDPNSAVIEGLDISKIDFLKSEGVVSYYAPGNSFYIVS